MKTRPDKHTFAVSLILIKENIMGPNFVNFLHVVEAIDKMEAEAETTRVAVIKNPEHKIYSVVSLRITDSAPPSCLQPGARRQPPSECPTLTRILALCEGYQNIDVEGKDPEDLLDNADIIVGQIVEIAVVELARHSLPPNDPKPRHRQDNK